MSVRNDGRSQGNHWQPDSKDVRHSNKQQNKVQAYGTGGQIDRKVAEFQQNQSGKHSVTMDRSEAKVRYSTRGQETLTADQLRGMIEARAAILEARDSK